VQDFIKQRPGDRFGLILFGEFAHMQAPLTYDHPALQKLLAISEPGMAGPATAIGDAIASSVINLRQYKSKKVLILLTDGIDNTSKVPIKKAVEIAKAEGIKIYTIGLGTAGAVPFPGPGGEIIMIEAPIDEVTLQNIAKVTGGLYYHAQSVQGLKAIYREIDNLEKTEYTKNYYKITTPLYQYPLTAALCLIIFAIFYPFFNGRRLW